MLIFNFIWGVAKKYALEKQKNENVLPNFIFADLTHENLCHIIHQCSQKSTQKSILIADILYVMVGQELWNPQAGSGMAKKHCSHILCLFILIGLCYN